MRATVLILASASLIAAQPAFAAAVTHATTTESTLDGTSYASGSFTPAANDLIVVTVYASGTAVANSPGTMTDSQGLGFTRVTSASGAPNSVYLFVANKLAAASAMTVTFAATGDDATGSIITVWRVAGMSRTGQSAVKQSKTFVNGNAGNSPTVSFSADCNTNNPTIALVGNQANPAGLTPPTLWTEPAEADVGYSTPIRGAEAVFRNTGFTGTTIKWGSASATVWHVVAVELDTSAAPTPTTKLGELCQKIDCGTVFSSFLKPTIDQVVPFLSNITSDGWVVVKGSGFGNEIGEFFLVWDFPLPFTVPLKIPTEPGKDHWTPTYVFGQLPSITGRKDEEACLVIKTKAGSSSNCFSVNFTAERELKQLQSSDVDVNCSDESDHDSCNSDFDTDSVPFCSAPFLVGVDATITGYHWTCVGDSEGTDTYSASLENGWLFESADFDDMMGANSATMTGFQSGTATMNVKVNWTNEDVSYVRYRMNISIKGPKGVPHN
jgi:hypothetical protein